jgi:hypothetical protein
MKSLLSSSTLTILLSWLDQKISKHIKSFERALKNRYEIHCLGKLSWFLGIRVVHNEKQGKVWLVQDSFIDKVAANFKLQTKSGRYPATPLNKGYLSPSDDEPNAAHTKEFWSLTGSPAFISCIIRPDVAKAHSVLAQRELSFQHGTRVFSSISVVSISLFMVSYLLRAIAERVCNCQWALYGDMRKWGES